MKFPKFLRRKSYYQVPVSAESDGRGVFFYALTMPGIYDGTRARQNVNTEGTEGQLNAYRYCAPLSTIINKKIQACNNGIYEVTNRKGEVIDYTIPLLESPNPLQSWQQFQTHALTALQVFGECFIYKLKASQYSKNVAALWVVPNQGMKINTTGKLFNQSKLSDIITGYTYSYQGQVVQNFTVDEITHVKDTYLNPVDPVHGYSRTATILDPIQNVISAYEARNVLMSRKGAIGILSNGSKDGFGGVPMTAEERERLQADFQRYGITKDRFQVIMTDTSMNWQSMTFPTKDMMLFEEIEDSVREIANTYGYPFPLLSFKNQSALGDGAMIDAANSVLYQDTVIPEMQAWTQVLAGIFNIPTGYTLKISYSHLPIFQEDERQQSEVLRINTETAISQYQGGFITLNQALAMMGQPEITGGDVLAGSNTSIPLAVQIGVGGTQSLQLILSDATLTNDQKRNALIILFGLSPADASALTS